MNNYFNKHLSIRLTYTAFVIHNELIKKTKLVLEKSMYSI